MPTLPLEGHHRDPHKLTPRSTAEAERREDLSTQPCARVSSQSWVIEGHPAPPRTGQGRRARSIKLRKRTAWALRAPKLLKRGAERDIDAKPMTHRPRWAGALKDTRAAGSRGGRLGGRLGGRKNWETRKLTEEDVLGIAAPDLVVAVLVDEGGGARGVTRHHVEAGLG